MGHTLSPSRTRIPGLSLLPCFHPRLTFPQTPRGQKRRTYVVCLDCGREFEYNWERMAILQKEKRCPSKSIPADQRA